MKNVLKVLCVLAAIYCIYFPLTYFHSDADKREVKISHILVDTEEQANKIRTEIEEDNDKTFEKAAEEYSNCPSKDDKGNLGYFMRNAGLIKEIEKEVFTMDLRKVSEPIKTTEGWHLLKVYDIIYFSDRKNFDERYSYI